ncbi:signal recognition particle-docking protein FtsY [Candidatus Dependentiae bacterium]|nr:signal recognition particle-docking protein FtsY [Candidatus Dependentiae bacterium]
MFSFLKKALATIYTRVTSKLRNLFGQNTVDEATLKELETILIGADTGIHTSRTIIENLKKELLSGTLTKGSDLEKALGDQLKGLLQKSPFNPEAEIYLLVGINGSGKTTFAGKLALWLSNRGKKVLLVAADTFRAAATEQLSSWAKTVKVPIVTGKEDQDPASVIFQGCDQFKAGSFEALIIDTAGRLQTKTNLMKELEKIRKILNKQLGERKILTLLTIDAMLGQNSFDQAKIFHESTHVDGIVLTKMDGTGKGGIVFSITHELKIPIAFISFGESPHHMDLFNADDYIKELLG